MATGNEGSVSETATLAYSDTPILQVLVIGFHHQKGSTIEFALPPLNRFFFSSSTNPLSLPPQWKPLPHIALPDGCHNYTEGHVMFSLPSITSDDNIYGVSCYRQIRADELDPLSTGNNEIKRSTVQKAVCVLCKWPLFDFITAKLKLSIHAYFNSKDFNDTSILSQTYEDLNSTLTQEHALSVCCHSNQLREYVMSYQHRLLQVFKTLLLEKKVLVYGENAGHVSSTVIAIGSLCPFYYDSLIDPAIKDANDQGFPLSIFPQPASFKPYLSLQQMKLLIEEEHKSLLVGVVNPLYHKQAPIYSDVLLHIDSGYLEIHNEHLSPLLNLSSADLRFCAQLKEGISPSLTRDSPTVQPTNWIGSTEWIQKHFKSYLLSLLASSLSGDSVAYDDHNSDFMTEFLQTSLYKTWAETSHVGMANVPPRHICEGDLSLGDIKRQLIVRASDYGLVDSKQAEQLVQKTGKTHFDE